MNLHTPVLQKEVVNTLNIASDDVVWDMTVGNGGHAKALCQSITSGKLIGTDADADAVAQARKTLQEQCECTVTIAKGNFRNINSISQALKIEIIDKALFDLGMRSEQLEDSGRGFSFQKDEPLLMTFKKRPTESDLTAWEIVNQWEHDNIVDIINGYGDERYAERIADAIVERRKYEGNIDTTTDLVEIITEAVPNNYDGGRIHPATRTFQALRITVNDEIEALKEGLEKTFSLLSEGGRMAVISFHSIEDRTVKHFMQEKERTEQIEVVDDMPIEPQDDEVETNPRARSAKLRVCQKI